jgi:hypothetical protein
VLTIKQLSFLTTKGTRLLTEGCLDVLNVALGNFAPTKDFACILAKDINTTTINTKAFITPKIKAE